MHQEGSRINQSMYMNKELRELSLFTGGGRGLLVHDTSTWLSTMGGQGGQV